MSALGVAGLILAMGTAAVVLHSGVDQGPVAGPPQTAPAPHRHGPPGGTDHHRGRRGATAPPGGSAAPPARSGSPVPVSGSLVVAPGPPILTSVTPLSGAAGQVVTLSGTDLFSTDGTVQAFLAGQPIPTSCPTQTSCTVTVPDLPGAPTGAVPLTVQTASGTSNAEPFSYR